MFRFYKQVEENISLSADFLLEVGLYKSDFFSTGLEDTYCYSYDYIMLGNKTCVLRPPINHLIQFSESAKLSLIILSAKNHTFDLPSCRIFIYL